MNFFCARAPFRIGLAGGGSDIEPFASTFGGGVYNFAINRYAYCTVQDSKEISFEAECIEKNSAINELNLPLHENAYLFFQDNFGVNPKIKISTFSEADMGSGLGASSAIVVSIVAALAKYNAIQLNKFEIAKAAIHIERKMCNFDGGQQDQYAASLGGLNLINFSQDGVSVSKSNIAKKTLYELEMSSLLVNLNTTRHSGNIISDQINNMKSSDDYLDKFETLKLASLEINGSFESGDWTRINKILNENWIMKRSTSKQISNSEIDKTISTLLDIGATSVKLCGAGGGGHLFCLVKREKRAAVLRYLDARKMKNYSISVDFQGVVTWTL